MRDEVQIMCVLCCLLKWMLAHIFVSVRFLFQSSLFGGIQRQTERKNNVSTLLQKLWLQTVIASAEVLYVTHFYGSGCHWSYQKSIIKFDSEFVHLNINSHSLSRRWFCRSLLWLYHQVTCCCYPLPSLHQQLKKLHNRPKKHSGLTF